MIIQAAAGGTKPGQRRARVCAGLPLSKQRKKAFAPNAQGIEAVCFWAGKTRTKT
jgi:hypothetical protein